MIEFRHVSAGHGKTAILRDISASFKKGELTGIIGINGCGKTTLLRTTLGFLPLLEGEILLDGEPVQHMRPNTIARKAAYLPQGRSTPDMTVEQLVLHGRFPHLHYPRQYTKHDREIALSAMQQTGIAEFAGCPLHSLSGGMRQNAYIAMALAQGADYILLDEPTTYLDISHQLELMNTLRTLARAGKGVITVLHDLPMAMNFSDRLLLLSGGRLAADDTPQNVHAQGLIEQAFDVKLVYSSGEAAYHYKYQRI